MPSAATAEREARNVGQEALSAQRSRPFRVLVRIGFVARALTYGVIGGIALALALGAGAAPASPNQQGSLSLIARAPLGRVALVVVCIGLLSYASWKLGQAAFGRGPEGGGSPKLKDRISNAAGGLVYIGLFVVAVRILLGSSGGGSSNPSRTTAGVLGWPGGRVIVAIAGGAFIAVCAYQIYDAVGGGFAESAKLGEMTERQRRTYMTVGRVGLCARSIVFGIVGYFLVRAAMSYDPHDAVGIDGVLARVHHEPLGTFLLALVAAGLLVFACYSLFDARYRRL
ncbi:MAG TPA: DUF1206 domain-containing protein [Solirubrobacteraceae bacterium]|jgi:hypothetical protein|nr:DUF1206 domain-containing protein [Solirubrobacteraceae bacterium]